MVLASSLKLLLQIVIVLLLLLQSLGFLLQLPLIGLIGKLFLMLLPLQPLDLLLHVLVRIRVTPTTMANVVKPAKPAMTPTARMQSAAQSMSAHSVSAHNVLCTFRSGSILELEFPL